MRVCVCGFLFVRDGSLREREKERLRVCVCLCVRERGTIIGSKMNGGLSFHSHLALSFLLLVVCLRKTGEKDEEQKTLFILITPE